jgi:hypothetical protein
MVSEFLLHFVFESACTSHARVIVFRLGGLVGFMKPGMAQTSYHIKGLVVCHGSPTFEKYPIGDLRKA